MALHGSATIELTNADGSKEVIKHDNIITNAPNDLLKGYSGGYATILKYMRLGDSFMQALFGGILLFSDSLDSDADAYNVPSGKVVGYASQDAYAGLDTARGSYNESESGAQVDGSYRFVWDFSTAQGNGTIKALALCPNIMGQIGMSATIVDSERKTFTPVNDLASPFQTNGYMLPNSGTDSTDDISNYNFLTIAIADDIVYAVNLDNISKRSSTSNYFLLNGGILRLYRFKLGLTSVTALASVGRAQYVDYVDVQLPTDFVSQFPSYTSDTKMLQFQFIPNSKKLVVYPHYLGKMIEPNSSFKYVEIDIANAFNVMALTFTNNTGRNIPVYGSDTANGSTTSVHIGEKYIVAVATTSTSTSANDYKFYAIKRSDNTNVKELKLVNEDEFITSSYRFQPNYMDANTFVITLFLPNYDYCVCFIDSENGIIHKTNAGQTYYYDNVSFSKVALMATGNYLKCKPLINPFVLCTKNNLDTAVTKTASQTMKITYTLTESAGV